MTGMHPWRQPWKRLGLLALLALGALAMACSDDAEADPTAAVTATAAATATEVATATPTAEAGPITVVDAGGTEILLEAVPQRIVSHSPGVTEILFAIGAGGQVIAADEFSTYPAETASLERVAYSNPDQELELSLNPDLVILSGRQEEYVEPFRGLGLTVYFAAEPTTIEGVFDTITTYGLITGHEAEAVALVADMQARLDALDATLAEVEEGPRVFFELTDTLYTVSTQSFLGAALERLKAQNVAVGADSDFPQLTAEAVIAADPEVILLADEAAGQTPETVAARPGWAAVTAVVEGRVFIIDDDRSSRPGPRIIDAMEEWAALLYPDLFE